MQLMDLSKTFRTPHSESGCRNRISENMVQLIRKKIETPGIRVDVLSNM